MSSEQLLSDSASKSNSSGHSNENSNLFEVKMNILKAAFNGDATQFWDLINKDESLIDAVDKDDSTVLHKASIKSKTIKLAKEIADKYPHLMYETDKYCCKPIHTAAYYGNADIFWYFIKKDKSLIDAVDKNDKTILHQTSVLSKATDFAKIMAIKFVLSNLYNSSHSVVYHNIAKNKSLIDAVDKYGFTVLHKACVKSYSVNLAKQITDKYPHLLYEISYSRNKPIHIAAEYGNADIFWYFIDKDECLIDAVDKNGETVLQKACVKSEAIDLAKQIVNKYPHLISVTNNYSCIPKNPLHIAMENLNAVIYGQKPIHIAAENGNADVFWYFIDKDESLIHTINENGDTVLHKACIKSNAVDLVKQIADKYPHLMQKENNDSYKAIHNAAKYGNADVFWYFINKDENLIDEVDKNENTVLHIVCVKSEAVDLAKQITDKYPHLLYKTDKYGRKPIHIATEIGNADVFWYFIDKDVSLIDAVDNDGDTVLHIACLKSYNNFAKQIAYKYPHLLLKTNSYGNRPILPY